MPKSVYRRRNPQNSPYYQCVEDHFDMFEMVYEDRFERKYGFFGSVKHFVGQSEKPDMLTQKG